MLKVRGARWLFAAVTTTPVLKGMALMKAREMGKLALDDPTQQYLPFNVSNPNHPDQVITSWQLATHTSGINDTDEYMNRSWIIRPGQDLTGINTDMRNDERARELEYYAAWGALELFLDGLDRE